MNVLLDTTVVSEIRRDRDGRVRERLAAATAPDSRYLSVLVVGELRTGIERLRKRDPQSASGLDAWLEQLVVEYRSRILPVDDRVAQEWGRLHGTLGPLPVVDGLLAATARMHELTVVTRNVADFARAGVPVFNPWEAHPEA